MPVAVKAPGNVKLSKVSVGAIHSCAEGDDDRVYCWGHNGNGRLGDGSEANRSTPVPVDVSTLPAGVTLSGVSAAYQHTCAVGSNGSVYCWGYDGHGRLGNGESPSSLVPDSVKAPGNMTFTRVTSGFFHTCAEGMDARIYCWGDNFGGLLGNGTDEGDSSLPDTVAAPAGVTLWGVSAGYEHTCAEGTDGNGTRIYCWGRNHHGQLGTGTVGGSSGVPVPVKSEGVKLVNVSARQEFSCAEGVSGGIYCWGGNFSGELGINSQTNSPEPVAVHVPAGVSLSSVSVGGYFACAVAPNGVYCWGQNTYGTLGDGTNTNRWTPVLVAGTKGP